MWALKLHGCLHWHYPCLLGTSPTVSAGLGALFEAARYSATSALAVKGNRRRRRPQRQADPITAPTTTQGGPLPKGCPDTFVTNACHSLENLIRGASSSSQQSTPQSVEAAVGRGTNPNGPSTATDRTNPVLSVTESIDAASALYSNGEEELELARGYEVSAYAQDMVPDTEESLPSAAPRSLPPTTAEMTRNGEEAQPKASDVVSATAAYTPLTLDGTPYYEGHAVLLAEAALTMGFASFFWSTPAAFHKVGATVTCDPAAGVVLPDTRTAIWLYNLEQTDYPNARHAKVGDIQCAYREERMTDAPQNLCGDWLPGATGCAIQKHRLYDVHQRLCPIWVSLREVVRLEAPVAAAERCNYVLVPRVTGPSIPEVAHESDAAHADLGVDRDAFNVYYNVRQLEDPERFTACREARKRIRCYNARGNRYRVETSWLLYEYCVRHHFPTDSFSVWLTPERLQRLGGHILPTPRGPAGAVPPPFTDIVGGELLTLVNAEQTSVLGEVRTAAERFFAERWDTVRPSRKL